MCYIMIYNMRNGVFSYLEIAAKLASKGSDKRSYYLGAVGARSDGAIVSSVNIPTRDKEPNAHAEYRLSKKLDNGSTVYVARILKATGDFKMSRPCSSCMIAMKNAGVTRVYYTIAPNEFGIIDL